MKTIDSIVVHEAAKLFPIMNDASYTSLMESIQKKGQIEPVKFFKGKLIDGRNRLKVCEELGIDILWEEIETDDPVGYVLAENLERRHLTTQQRAAIAAELANMTDGNPHRDENSTGSNEPVKISNEDAATMMGVSTASVKRAKKIMKEDPIKHKNIKKGIKVKKQGVKKVQNQKKKSWLKIATDENILRAGAGGNDIKKIKEDILSVSANPDIFNTGDEEQLREACILLRLQKDPETHGKSKKELEEIVSELTKDEEDKVDKAIRLAKRDIEVEIQHRVTQQLNDILPMYNKEHSDYQKFNNAYSGVLTTTEYKKIISVLHSDRIQDELLKRKFDEVFNIIQKKKDLLCGRNGSEKTTGTLPENVADLMAMRKSRM